MKANPKSFLSPTLGENKCKRSLPLTADIDLAWHTHQLHGKGYRGDTTRYIGRLVDHDDKIADVRLKKAYDDTASLWASRFGVPYSGCGCPVPHTAKRNLDSYHRKHNRHSSRLKFWKIVAHRRDVAMAKARIAEMTRDMPVEERGASCPSTHNLVYIHSYVRNTRLRRATAETDHTDPFASRFVFVPRRVRGTRATFIPPQRTNRDRDAADAYMYGYPMYWGVAPYAYGPYPIVDPWLGDRAGGELISSPVDVESLC
jgi:hypothetical protein